MEYTLKEQNGVVLANGRPAAQISVTLSETIGLPQYSSVKVGPITITRYIEEGDDEHIIGEMRTASAVVEEFLSEIRTQILEEVQASKK